MAQKPSIPEITPDTTYYIQFNPNGEHNLTCVRVEGVQGNVVIYSEIEKHDAPQKRISLSMFAAAAATGEKTMLARLDKLPATADKAAILSVLNYGVYLPIQRKSHKLPHAIEPVKIHMKTDVLLEGHEGDHNVAQVQTYADANKILTRWASKIEHLYHEEITFTVKFADGQTYSGEYMLYPKGEQSLGLSMYCYLTWHANIYFPTNRSADWLEKGEPVEIASTFLKKYDIDAYNGVDAANLPPPAPLTEPRQKPSRFIIGVQPVETLVIAGGEVLDFNDPRPLLVQIMAAKNMRRDENIGVLSEIAKTDSELGKRAAALLEQFKQEGQ